MAERKIATHLVECPICKKKYVPAPQHAWKIGFDELVCSYGCMRHWECTHGGGVRKNASRKKD